MKTEQLIAKGVEKHFNGQQVLFKVASLKEHFDGLQIHESDILPVEIQNEEGDVVSREDHVKAADVDFRKATANVVEPKQLEEVNVPLVSGMSYEEAEKLLKIGGFIALPEWGGFWFGNIKTGEVLVLTKDGEITNTPFEEFKERQDWITVIPSEEQMQLIKDYFDSLEIPKPVQDTPVEHIDVVVTEETPVENNRGFDENPIVEKTIILDGQPNKVVSLEDIKENGVIVGQNIIVDAETPKPKTKKATAKK